MRLVSSCVYTLKLWYSSLCCWNKTIHREHMTVNVEKITAVTELCMLTENHDLSYCWFTWRKELIDNRKKSRNLNSWSMAENCRSTPWQVIIIWEISPSLLVKLDGRCIRNKFLQHFMKYCWESMLPVLPPAWTSHHAIFFIIMYSVAAE